MVCISLKFLVRKKWHKEMIKEPLILKLLASFRQIDHLGERGRRSVLAERRLCAFPG
jgi:hypothetical protein